MTTKRTQIDRLWEIVDGAQPPSVLLEPDANEAYVLEATRAQLKRLSDTDLEAFANAMVNRVQEAATNEGVYRVATLLAEGGLSDDAYADFCAWLVSLGRGAYEQVLRDADALGSVTRLDIPRSFFFEKFGGLAARVYRERTGEDFDGDTLDSSQWAVVAATGAEELERQLPRVSRILKSIRR